jgi:hypothetical protein
MSHFTVLAIGEDVEKQLAPFHEFECTGIDDEYVQDIDITEEVLSFRNDDVVFDLKEALEWHGLEDRVVKSGSEVHTNGKHKYGYAIVNDGKLIKAVDRTNPNAKWDGYQVGGRWTGFFKLKHLGKTGGPGIMTKAAKPGYADVAYKQAVDFEGMRADACAEAKAQWEAMHAIIEPHIAAFIPWDKMRDEVHPGNIDAAREAYHAQSANVAKNTSENDNIRWASVEPFLCSCEEYIERARNKAICTFAVLKDGQWYERGAMGWWGMVADDKGDEWPKQFNELLDSLPDDTLLTVVDCHI